MKVDWAQPGEAMENLVAVLIRRENPAATQIRASQGDGGMDVRAPGRSGGVEIHQVKKFNSTLSASQLRQVKESFDSLDEYRIELGLDVRAWHLVMPLNPTKENLEWFDELTADAPFPCDWRGRDYLDGLAAKFPDVVDYYLQDGADRLERVVGQLVEVMKLTPKAGGDGIVTPAQVMDQLHALQPLLDTDPHFRYAIGLDVAMPELEDLGKGFIAAMSAGTAGGDCGVVTVKIYPRFAEALEYRPIPGAVTFRAQPGSGAAEDLERFIKYGAPLRTGPGSVDFEIDLPGGLGGSFQGGSARVGPAETVGGSKGWRLRLVVMDASGRSVAVSLVDMGPWSVGVARTGRRAVGTETSRAFDLELLDDLTTHALKLNLSMRDVAGRAPGEVIDAIRFLRELRAPNKLSLEQPFGPLGGPQVDLSDDWLDFDQLAELEHVLDTLAAIQGHTSTQIVVPPLETIDSDSADTWLSARQLLDGEVLSVEELSARVCLHRGASIPTQPIAVAIASDLVLNIGDQQIHLGRQLAHAAAFQLVEGSVVEHEDHQDCTLKSLEDSAPTIRLIKWLIRSEGVVAS